MKNISHYVATDFLFIAIIKLEPFIARDIFGEVVAVEIANSETCIFIFSNLVLKKVKNGRRDIT